MGLESGSYETISERQDSPTGDVSRDEDYLRKIRDHLRETTGIRFEDQQLHSLKGSLDKRLRVLGLSSYREYYERLMSDSEEFTELVSTVSVNKTAFFREREQWDYLKSHLVEILTAGSVRSSRTVKCWSAACSTGEEVYSMGVVEKDIIRSLRSVGGPEAEIRILGTDISHRVLERARDGRYRRSDLEPVRDYDPRGFYRYFNRVSENEYEPVDELRKTVSFRQFNLKNENYPFKDNFDVIFCRNVLIYFRTATVTHVIHRLSEALRPGGLLFLSRTEHLKGIDHPLTKVRPSVFRRPTG